MNKESFYLDILCLRHKILKSTKRFYYVQYVTSNERFIFKVNKRKLGYKTYILIKFRLIERGVHL